MNTNWLTLLKSMTAKGSLGLFYAFLLVLVALAVGDGLEDSCLALFDDTELCLVETTED